MELANTTLINEVIAIGNADGPPIRYNWECLIEAGGVQHAVYKLLSIDIVRDYAGAYADEVMLEVMLGGGTFAELIMPYKEDLKVTLFKMPSTGQGNQSALNQGIVTQQFKATLAATPGDSIAPPTPQMTTAAEGDLISIRRITFQLQDVALEQIRLMTLGTSIRKATPAQALRALVTRASESIQVDVINQIKGMTMVEAHNQEVRDHIVIPHGTPLVSLADFLQEKAGGIYSAGLGFYLQKGMWYVWPLFDLSRFEQSAKTLTIIVLPTSQLDSVERTFRITPYQTILMVTGGASYDDSTEVSLNNQGNGVRFADARKIVEGFGEVKNNKVIAKRTFNNTEFVGLNRASGLNNVQMTGITSNVFAEASKLARRKGSILTVNWQNSDSDLLRPDIPVQVIYTKDGLPVTLNAALLQTHTYIASDSPGITSNTHMSNTAITLFVEKDLPALKAYLAESPT